MKTAVKRVQHNHVQEIQSVPRNASSKRSASTEPKRALDSPPTAPRFERTAISSTAATQGPSLSTRSIAPSTYSTLFFRVLLVSAIGLTLLGMSRSQKEATPEPFTPEISTGQVQVNPQADGRSVDDPPPDVFVQLAE